MPDPLRVNTAFFVIWTIVPSVLCKGKGETPIEEEKRHVAVTQHDRDSRYQWGRLSSERFGARFVAFSRLYNRFKNSLDVGLLGGTYDGVLRSVVPVSVGDIP